MRDNVPAKLSHSSLNVLGKRVIRQQSAGSSSLKLIMQQFIGQNGLTTARIAKQQKTRPAWDRPSNHLFQMIGGPIPRSEEHTSELQSRPHLVCRLLPAKNISSLLLYHAD